MFSTFFGMRGCQITEAEVMKTSAFLGRAACQGSAQGVPEVMHREMSVLNDRYLIVTISQNAVAIFSSYQENNENTKYVTLTSNGYSMLNNHDAMANHNRTLLKLLESKRHIGGS
jgi:hypothetical protein